MNAPSNDRTDARSVVMDDEQWQALQAAADRKHTTAASILRRLATAYLHDLDRPDHPRARSCVVCRVASTADPVAARQLAGLRQNQGGQS